MDESFTSFEHLIPSLYKVKQNDDDHNSASIVYALLANAGDAGMVLTDIVAKSPDKTDCNFALMKLASLDLLIRPRMSSTPRDSKTSHPSESKQGPDDDDRAATETWVLTHHRDLPFLLKPKWRSSHPMPEQQLIHLLKVLARQEPRRRSDHARDAASSPSAADDTTKTSSTSKYSFDAVMQQGQGPVSAQDDGKLDWHTHLDHRANGSSINAGMETSAIVTTTSTTTTRITSTATTTATTTSASESSVAGSGRVLFRAKKKKRQGVQSKTSAFAQTTSTAKYHVWSGFDGVHESKRGLPQDMEDIQTDTATPDKEAATTTSASSIQDTPPPVLMLKHPAFSSAGSTRKPVAIVVRPTLLDGSDQASSHDDQDEDTVEDEKVKELPRHVPETVAPPVEPVLLAKLSSLPGQVQVRLQMSLAYTATFLVLASRRSRGVESTEWSTAVPKGIETKYGLDLLLAAEFLDAAHSNIHTVHPTDEAKHTETLSSLPVEQRVGVEQRKAKLILKEQYWIFGAEASQHMIKLTQRQNAIAAMEVFAHDSTWKKDTPESCPFSYKTCKPEAVPFQTLYMGCTVKNDSLSPALLRNDKCSMILHDELVGLICYVKQR